MCCPVRSERGSDMCDGVGHTQQGFELQELQKELVAKYRKHEKDVGSSAVQVALMTAKVSCLKDFSRIPLSTPSLPRPPAEQSLPRVLTLFVLRCLRMNR